MREVIQRKSMPSNQQGDEIEQKEQSKQIILSGFADEIDSDLEKQLQWVRELGMDYISLRSAWGKNIGDYSVLEVNQRILPLLERYQIKVSSIGSPIGKLALEDEQGWYKQLEMAERIAEIAHLLNCQYVRLFSFYLPETILPSQCQEAVLAKLRPMIQIFANHQITALHENEKGIYGDSAQRCQYLLQEINSPWFGAIFDFANFVQIGEDPLTAYELLKPYIRYFHIKDARFHYEPNVICGTGDGQIKPILTRAIHSGYQGFLTLEPHLASFEGFAGLEQITEHSRFSNSQAINGKQGYALQYDALSEMLAQIIPPITKG